MSDDRSRLSHTELHEYDARKTALRHLAMQTAIGQELRAKCDLPQELPQRIFALLTQLDAQQEAPEQAVPQAYIKLVDGIAEWHAEPRQPATL
jgi:hypothetical protein